MRAISPLILLTARVHVSNMTEIPAPFVYDRSELRPLLAALREEEQRLLDSCSMVYSDVSNRNVWIDCSLWLRVFTALRLPDGFRLAALWSGGADYRTRSRMLAVNTRVLETGEADHTTALPTLPDALATYRMNRSLHVGERAPTPAWVAWDVMPLIRDDGTSAAIFQRAWFTRCELSLMHHDGWLQHVILVDGPAEFPRAQAERQSPVADDESGIDVSRPVPKDPSSSDTLIGGPLSQLRRQPALTDWRRLNSACWPTRWGVYVWHDLPPFDASTYDYAPRDYKVLQQIGAAPCMLVEFYTIRSRYEIFRHRDWVRGETLIAREEVKLASAYYDMETDGFQRC